MPTRSYRVHGLVQGVGYRWWARTQAEGLGLTGTIRNDPDGSVVVVASGDETALAAFRACLERGPTGARVDRVDEADGPGDEFDEFRIVR